MRSPIAGVAAAMRSDGSMPSMRQWQVAQPSAAPVVMPVVVAHSSSGSLSMPVPSFCAKGSRPAFAGPAALTSSAEGIHQVYRVGNRPDSSCGVMPAGATAGVSCTSARSVLTGPSVIQTAHGHTCRTAEEQQEGRIEGPVPSCGTWRMASVPSGDTLVSNESPRSYRASESLPVGAHFVSVLSDQVSKCSSSTTGKDLHTVAKMSDSSDPPSTARACVSSSVTTSASQADVPSAVQPASSAAETNGLRQSSQKPAKAHKFADSGLASARSSSTDLSSLGGGARGRGSIGQRRQARGSCASVLDRTRRSVGVASKTPASSSSSLRLRGPRADPSLFFALNSTYPVDELVAEIIGELLKEPPPTLRASVFKPDSLRVQLRALILGGIMDDIGPCQSASGGPPGKAGVHTAPGQCARHSYRWQTPHELAAAGRPMHEILAAGIRAQVVVALHSHATWSALERAVVVTCVRYGINTALVARTLMSVGSALGISINDNDTASVVSSTCASASAKEMPPELPPPTRFDQGRFSSRLAASDGLGEAWCQGPHQNSLPRQSVISGSCTWDAHPITSPRPAVANLAGPPPRVRTPSPKKTLLGSLCAPGSMYAPPQSKPAPPSEAWVRNVPVRSASHDARSLVASQLWHGS